MPKKPNTLTLGSFGENYAVGLLQRKGYTLLQKNFRSRFGEIDIVMRDGDTLVFVEVKTRRSALRGLPEEAVDERKLAKIKLTADYYNKMTGQKFKKQRIEVISLLVDYTQTVVRERHIRVGW